jgi:hypothetical protein
MHIEFGWRNVLENDHLEDQERKGNINMDFKETNCEYERGM